MAEVIVRCAIVIVALSPHSKGAAHMTSRISRVGKGALAPCPPSSVRHGAVRWWARQPVAPSRDALALPTQRSPSSQALLAMTGLRFPPASHRHCERSEAIQELRRKPGLL